MLADKLTTFESLSCFNKQNKNAKAIAAFIAMSIIAASIKLSVKKLIMKRNITCNAQKNIPSPAYMMSFSKKFPSRQAREIIKRFAAESELSVYGNITALE
jgi:hypothetical protein